MESHYKNGYGAMMTGSGEANEVAVANERKIRGWDLVLRVVAVALSLAAAVVQGANKQTVTVAVTLVATLPAVNVPVTARWHDLSSSVYFLVANAIACAYGATSLLFVTLANRSQKRGVVIIFDLVMVALLFSGVGAASAVGLLAYEGNSHLRWTKVCNVFGRYCRQGTAALALSGAASVVFFSLVLLAILNLHKKH